MVLVIFNYGIVLEKCGIIYFFLIIIGKNVWIGVNVIVVLGVIIGDNVIIVVGVVVIKNVVENIIVGGVFVKFLRVIDEILE